MKQRIRVIFVFVLLLLLIVIVVVVIVIVLIKVRGYWWVHNFFIFTTLVLVAAVVGLVAVVIGFVVGFVLAQIWLRISVAMRRPLTRCGSIVQKYYQRYRKQFLRLCCCSYHVPPGPGPGGGGGNNGSGTSDDRHFRIREESHFQGNKSSCSISRKNISGSRSIKSRARSKKRGEGHSSSGGGNGSNSSINNTATDNIHRKTSRRRRSLSGGLIWLLIGLVWLEGPLLISCKMNSNGDHMIKINSSTNRIMSIEQQNKKLDIISNNKRFNKVYNKSSSNNNNKVGGAAGSTSGGSNNSNGNSGGTKTGSGNKNNYSNRGTNSNRNNNKNNENNNTNTKNTKLKNNLGRGGGNESNNNALVDQQSNSNRPFYIAGTDASHNRYNLHVNNDNKNTDNNYYRYANNYNYVEHYQIEEKQGAQHQQQDQDYHYHTPVHLSDGHQQNYYPQHQTYNMEEDTNKRSILASIGCPNCVFNNNYNNYNNKPFISSDTSSLETFLSHQSVAMSAPSSTNPNINNYSDDNDRQHHRQYLRRAPKIVNNNLSSDMIRLESIKHQILSKLGMKSKPNVSHPLPKQFIMDTLYRADGGDYVGVNFGFHSTKPTPSDMSDDNDFSVNDDYGGGSTPIGADSDDPNGDHLSKFMMYNSPNSESSSNFVFDIGPTNVNNGDSDTLRSGSGSGSAAEIDALSSRSYQYQKSQEENFIDTDDFFGSTKEIITFAERGKMFNGHRLIEFSSPADQVTGQHLQIRSATIWIKIDSRQQTMQRRMQHHTNETHLTIWIFQLAGDDLKAKDFDELATFSSSLSVKRNQLGWQKLDVTETVRQWYGRGKSEKLRLLIDCTGCGHRYNLHLFQRDSENDNQQNFGKRHSNRMEAASRRKHHLHHQKYSSYSRRLHRRRQSSKRNHYQMDRNHHRHRSSRRQATFENADDGSSEAATNVDPNRPFLVIYTDPNRIRRVRRRAIDCSGAINGQCCKESFYVSFKALGWDDWIIAPHGYFANYCRGDCGGPHRTPDAFQSYHTHVMEEFRKMDRLNGMQPCCAPLKFSSMSLIYYGNEGIIKRDLPKMVVDECGCP